MHFNSFTLPNLFSSFIPEAPSRSNVIDARKKLDERRQGHSPNRKPRVVLYSHDTMGLGHIRRNLLLAQAMTGSELNAEVLLITGARESGRFNLPKGADVVVLPALHKAMDGKYAARNLSLPLEELISIRSQLVMATIKSFRPDLVIVDNVARGINGELDQALRYIRDDGKIRCVLGLRDVRDEPEAVHREWTKQRCFETIRNFYHEVWVYGDSRVYDPRTEYNLPADIAARVRFTGYLDQRARLNGAGGVNRSTPAKKPFGLCMVGGGQDGAALAAAFAAAAHPAGMQMVVVTGPYMDAVAKNRLRVLAQTRPHLKVLEFVQEPTQLLRDAEFVITMGGYNTVCEVLSFEKRALVVPRVVPRREQIIRAERLQSLGVIDMLHPDQLNAASLGEWMNSLSGTDHAKAHEVMDIKGLQRLPRMVSEQVARNYGCADARPEWAVVS